MNNQTKIYEEYFNQHSTEISELVKEYNVAGDTEICVAIISKIIAFSKSINIIDSIEAVKYRDTYTPLEVMARAEVSIYITDVLQYTKDLDALGVSSVHSKLHRTTISKYMVNSTSFVYGTQHITKRSNITNTEVFSAVLRNGGLEGLVAFYITLNHLVYLG